ncbi:MAG TPA: hypothetical protein PKY31_10515, partial [Spirochaetota bacterium]|nr:hypothetical protein [Spirochaetota bacterium]
MNALIEKDKSEIRDAVPVLQAETFADNIWYSVVDKIVPECLFNCFNEDGIAQTAAKILQNEIFYKPETDQFFIRIHSQYYQIDLGNIVFFAIRQIGRRLNQIKGQFAGDAGEALAKALKKTGANAGLRAIMSIMKTEPSLIRMNDEIDPHGLIMTPGGARVPFGGDKLTRPGAVFTRCTNYDPEVGAVPVEFYKFLFDIFKIENPQKSEKNNEEATGTVVDRLLDIIAVAQAGYAPKIEKVPVLSGKGGTGKQQFLECLEKVFGSYFLWMRPESLYETKSAAGDTPRSDLFRIQTSLINGISEPSDAKISASLFKTLGSGEPIPCRPHHSQNVIDVRPRGLFIIASKRKP